LLAGSIVHASPAAHPHWGDTSLQGCSEHMPPELVLLVAPPLELAVLPELVLDAVAWLALALLAEEDSSAPPTPSLRLADVPRAQPALRASVAIQREVSRTGRAYARSCGRQINRLSAAPS
jgi:hypothetical protein